MRMNNHELLQRLTNSTTHEPDALGSHNSPHTTRMLGDNMTTRHCITCNAELPPIEDELVKDGTLFYCGLDCFLDNSIILYKGDTILHPKADYPNHNDGDNA